MGSRLIAIIVLVVAASVLVDRTAWAQSCPNPPKRPEITLTVNEGNVSYDQSLTTAEISRLAAQRGGVQHQELGNILGLTLGDLGIRTAAQFTAQQVAANRYCVWITDLRVTVGYESMTVFIDKKYREGSCPYNRILEHENQHVLINRRVLTSFTQAIADTLEQAVADLNPHVTHVPSTTQQAVFDKIQQRMQPVYNAYRARLKKEQEPLDTIANYNRIQSYCKDW